MKHLKLTSILIVLLTLAVSCEKETPPTEVTDLQDITIVEETNTRSSQTVYYDGSEGQAITKAEADYKVQKWQDAQQEGDVYAVYSGKDIINSILAQSGATGIRFYFASDSTDENTLVMVGVNQYDEDIYDDSTGIGIIADRLIQSPCSNCWYCECVDAKRVWRPWHN